MIIVYTDKEKYFYDIHSLVKSFYPEEDVLVFVKGSRQIPEDADVILTIDMTLSWDEGHIDADFIWDGRATKSFSMDCIRESEACSADMTDSPKNVLKRLLYTALNEETGKDLPWGTLTGIRPVKIAMHRLLGGDSDSGIRDYMKKTYICSDEKTDLSIEIAHRENRLLEGTTDGKGYSLYVNIPFCPTRCAYCSFMSSPIGLWKGKVDDYLDCIKKEIDQTAPLFKDKRLDSIYIGGGTPTTLEPYQLEKLIDWIKDSYDTSYAREFTIESGRPDSITMDKLKAMKKGGVTRISVNPQTMRDRTLELIGRHHSVQQTIDSFHMAREAGFDHINMDIILGLPGEELSDVQYTMDEIAKLGPDELTVHSLAIKRASRLYDYVADHGLAGMDTTSNMMKVAEDGARSMGLGPYYLYRQKNISGNFENTGYGRGDKMCLYNIITMEETQSILALGSGSVSKRIFEGSRIERKGNPKDVKLYMENTSSDPSVMRDFFS
jgi:oxygen-independent coproporphyrinogen-3 oxidase